MENINDLMPLSNDWNKERLTLLKNLFPDLFTNEGKLNLEELKKIIDPQSVTETERFEFRWFGKSEAKRNAFTPSNATLIFDEQRSVNPTESKNIIIEGENLETLKLLSNGYREQVKCIYIDPPYNTGNKDFRYNDNFIDKENGGRHTLWLSFMKNRLELAKELLKDTGVIFISIDDNEQAQLKLLCDRIFKEENFIANVVWQKRTSPDARKNLAAAHDYVLCYAKYNMNLKLNLVPLSIERANSYKNPDKDIRGVWASVDLTGQTGHATSSQYYTMTSSNGEMFTPPEGRCWAIAENTFKKLLNDNRIWFGNNGSSRPRLKKFLSETEGRTVWTWWTNTEVGNTQEATKELNQVLGFADALATTPKPTKLIDRILKLATTKDSPSVILDFFAGSGTTGHAVLELNKQDDGRRQFILVTNNEVTDKTQAQLRKEGKTESQIEALGICRSVTYPRLQKVIEGYTTPKGEKVEGTGGRLRYYRTEFIERSPNFDQQAYNFKGKCTEMLCIKENVFTPLADSNDKPYDSEG